jgi:SAM-dependent methyltransferase
MPDWDFIFRKKGRVFQKPLPELKEACAIFKEQHLSRILDLGSGTGRHTVYMSGLGFDVYSMDASSKGISETRKWLAARGLRARLKVASFYNKFPYDAEYFDAVVSTQAIHHNIHKKVLFCLSEIGRVLRPGGLFFLTVPYKKNQKMVKRYRTIADHTYVPLEGDEEGLPHYLYTKKSLAADLSGFRIVSIKKDATHFIALAMRKQR